ncbi:MAG: sigma-54-dependent Fis family transcriptional regulator [Planctomycetes bacterium]|nr:sigma-54-dependent Fis family transcriptional regulator [Planctomycetota bacterium]
MAVALVIDDDRASLEALAELVRQEGFAAETAASLREARRCLRAAPPDLVITDLKLPDGSGLALFAELEPFPEVEIVVVTGHASVDTAVEALRLGATDYLTKPVDVARLKSVLANLARRRELRLEIASLRDELRRLGRFGLLIGGSPAMQAVYDLIARVAPTGASVFLTGESGTGKELVARTIHTLSRRRRGPFVAVNCGAISPTLIESELFGHERGSFTGASRQHDGYFERAAGGTAFLDEITEMPVELQVKLLRVLETGKVVRVGGTAEIPVDVRVVTATNRPAEALLADDGLREDLYYRLNVFPIEIPPLRERPEDIELLVASFLAELNRAENAEKGISEGALKRLQSHSWPGNVRELRNVVHRAFILAEERIEARHLPLEGPVVPGAGAPELRVKLGTSTAEAERQLILATLDHLGGDKKQAAKVLGISLKTLYTRLSSYGQK